MKINYLQHVEMVNAIHADLNDLRGDLADEVFEFETRLVEAFKPQSKRAEAIQEEFNAINKEKHDGGEVSKASRQAMETLNTELKDIYKTEKELLTVDAFPYGDGSDRDLKPHLTLKGIRALDPVLERPTNNTEDDNEDSK